MSLRSRFGKLPSVRARATGHFGRKTTMLKSLPSMLSCIVVLCLIPVATPNLSLAQRPVPPWQEAFIASAAGALTAQDSFTAAIVPATVGMAPTMAGVAAVGLSLLLLFLGIWHWLRLGTLSGWVSLFVWILQSCLERRSSLLLPLSVLLRASFPLSMSLQRIQRELTFGTLARSGAGIFSENESSDR